MFLSAVEARFKTGSSSCCCIWAPCVRKNVEMGSVLDGVNCWDSGAVLPPMHTRRVQSPLGTRGTGGWQVTAGYGVYIKTTHGGKCKVSNTGPWRNGRSHSSVERWVSLVDKTQRISRMRKTHAVNEARHEITFTEKPNHLIQVSQSAGYCNHTSVI